MAVSGTDDILPSGGKTMSTAPKPPLQLSATCLGPVAKLDATLSKNAQNMIYARNGTGKSFLTRALRYIDAHAQGGDISKAAFDLVAEESHDSQGRFTLVQGSTSLATLSLNLRAGQVAANTHDRIFHVFSDDFVHAELRQRNFDMDGNIENEIRIDQVNIDTKDAQEKLATCEKASAKAKIVLQDGLETQKVEQLVNKAAVSKRLKEYMDCRVESVLAHVSQPTLPARAVKEILSDLDALKAIPAEPEYPEAVATMQCDPVRLKEIGALIEKITSPSSISEEIKTLISSRADFFETGLEALKDSGGENCPFCQQSIAHPPANDHIRLYIAYFADAEGKHKKDLRAAWSDIKNYRNTLNARVASMARETLKFEALRKLVPSQRDVVLPDLTGSVAAVDSILGSYLTAIEAKGHAPGTTVPLPVGDIQSLLLVLNKEIDSIGRFFASITAAVEASDTERKKLQREICAAFETEFAHARWSEITAIDALERDIAIARKELEDLKKSQLSASVKERVAATFETLIKSFFGDKYTFDRTEFVLKRENRKMARGASRTLSDGEKTAIAFCYFIACTHRKVKSTSDYAKIFLVFDDPITSMSYDFIFSIAQALKNLSIGTGGEMSINPADIAKGSRPDLLIFTHSRYFFNVCVTNNVIKNDGAFFLHQANGEHRLSKRTQYIAPFDLHLKEIFDVHGGKEPDHTTGNAVRCVLEAIGRFCHPDKCDSLSNFITFLAGDGGFEIKSVLINHMSHGTYYDETPSPDELREACADALLIVDKYARGQLELLRALTSPPVSAATRAVA